MSTNNHNKNPNAVLSNAGKKNQHILINSGSTLRPEPDSPLRNPNAVLVRKTQPDSPLKVMNSQPDVGPDNNNITSTPGQKSVHSLSNNTTPINQIKSPILPNDNSMNTPYPEASTQSKKSKPKIRHDDEENEIQFLSVGEKKRTRPYMTNDNNSNLPSPKRIKHTTWSHQFDNSLLSRFTRPTPHSEFGLQFKDLLRSDVFIKAYHPEMSYHEQVQAQASYNDDDNDESNGIEWYLGPGLPDEFVADADNAMEDVHTISRDTLTPEDAEKYNIDVKSDLSNTYGSLRREILIHLSKRKFPIFNFLEDLASEFGSNYTVDDFVWVFPQDIVNLSRKEPVLLRKQDYDASDFIRELLLLFAKNSLPSGSEVERIKTDDFNNLVLTIQSILQAIRFRGNPEQNVKLNPNPNSNSSNDTNKKKKQQTVAQPEIKEEDGEKREGRSKSRAPTSKRAISQTPAPYNSQNPEKEFRLNAWIKAFDLLTRPDLRNTIFKYEEDPNANTPLGLLLVKPIVRGMIRSAHSQIITETQSNFTVEELMYSPLVSTYFARFIATNQSIANTRLGSSNPAALGEILSKGNFQGGNVNIYNSRATRYTMAFQINEKVAAMEYFKLVRRVKKPGHPDYLAYIAPRGLNSYSSTSDNYYSNLRNNRSLFAGSIRSDDDSLGRIVLQ